MKVINPSKQHVNDISHIKVNINEKLDKLVKMIQGGGSLMFNGKIIEKPEEMTFVQAVAIEGSNFGLLQSEVSGVAIMWRRFKRIYYNDYFYMRTLPYFDAACFIPLKNIIFHGFGILAHYN